MINLVSWNIENQSNMVIFNGCLSALKIITKPNKSVKMDAPPCGGFESLVFIKVRRLRLRLVSGTPLTITLGSRIN